MWVHGEVRPHHLLTPLGDGAPALVQDLQGRRWPAPQSHPCPLCPQILLGHPPTYAVDVTTQVATVPAPAAILSPPLPEVLLPPVPELLPQLPGSLAPTVIAAPQSVPVQTAALLPPANLPLPSGPGIPGPCPTVQLTVEPAPEVCGPPLGAQPPVRHPDS